MKNKPNLNFITQLLVFLFIIGPRKRSPKVKINTLSNYVVQCLNFIQCFIFQGNI